jgi:subtilisin family serine protease
MAERGVKASSRRVVRRGVAIAVLALIVGTVSAAGVAPSAGSANAPVTVKRSHLITLVTGDRVVLNVLSNGKQTATVANPAGPAGRQNVFRSFHAVKENGDLYVYPVEVGPYLGRQLDRQLFNLTALVEQGYADKASATLPVIVTLKEGATRSTLPGGITRTRTLQSIDALAGRELKKRAATFGRALKTQIAADAPALRQRKAGRLWRSGPFAGVEAVYLDEKVKASLADSVPQIGAPAAWAAGFDGTGMDVAVLDTGIDSTHPDLAGKVVAEQNFSDSPSASDGFGHGTHVASIVAGSGAGLGGLRKGVAPGAKLLNGKVLNDFGSGLDSWIIAGMEWAADNGAEVISMSLQGGMTDGNDPMAQAVNSITASKGVLFTIAAGNFGFFGEQSVTTPGTANSALTVGAVSKSNVLADFSGRGPRLGDFAVKPDVTAPGVDIIAARAAGTALGPIVDDIYTMLSGTSMATPHVAGAAAILKQEFPLWTPEQLKSALVSTAVPGPYSVYQQGGGRIDVARAFSQKVYATPAPIDFGYFPWPHDTPEQVTKTITYANGTAAAVTLELTVEVTAKDGTPAAPGQVTTSASSVTVPAGGTATVNVTVDEGVGSPSLYGGFITAKNGDGSVVVRTPVGFYKEPEMYNLTVDGIARDGRPARGISWVEVVDADNTTRYQQTKGLGAGPVTFRVAPGTYSVMGFLATYDEPQVFALEESQVGDPQVDVGQDMNMVLDARLATEVIAHTAQPTEVKHTVFGYYRAGAQFGSWESLFLVAPPIKRVFAAPTEQVTRGDFGFRAKPTLGAPELEIAIAPPNAMTLDATYAFGAPKVDGSRRLDLVYAGYGRVQDFEGLDVHGKAVLITRGPLPPVGNPITFAEKVANATAAGAALALIHNHSPGLLLIGLDPATTKIPVLSLSKAQGEQLQALLAQGKELTLALKGVLQSPYLYDVIFAERGRIQDTHTRTLDQSNTAQINAGYHAQVESWLAGEARHAYPPWSGFSFDGARNLNVPFARTDYVATGDSRWFHVAWGSMTNDHIFEWSQQDPLVTYTQAAKLSEDWFAQPQRPGVIRTYSEGDNGEPVVREGNTITGFVPSFQDPAGRWGLHDSRTDSAPFQLYENGSLIGQSEGFFGSYAVSASPAAYRAELDVTRTAPYWRMSTNTHTTWRFASSPPPDGVRAVLPLLLVDYNLGGIDLQNRSSRGIQQIDLFAHRQQGANAAVVSGLTASVSYNDGATWQPATVKGRGDGHFTVTVRNPNVSGPYVSLRVEATDSGGSSINQTIIRAYGLK